MVVTEMCTLIRDRVNNMEAISHQEDILTYTILFDNKSIDFQHNHNMTEMRHNDKGTRAFQSPVKMNWKRDTKQTNGGKSNIISSIEDNQRGHNDSHDDTRISISEGIISKTETSLLKDSPRRRSGEKTTSSRKKSCDSEQITDGPSLSKSTEPCALLKDHHKTKVTEASEPGNLPESNQTTREQTCGTTHPAVSTENQIHLGNYDAVPKTDPLNENNVRAEHFSRDFGKRNVELKGSGAVPLSSTFNDGIRWSEVVSPSNGITDGFSVSGAVLPSKATFQHVKGARSDRGSVDEDEPMSSSSVLDMFYNLHANIDSKSESEFVYGLSKTESLQYSERAILNCFPLFTLSTRDRPFWEAWRLGTFSQMGDLAASAIRLAQSGFYYDVQVNDVKCFSCGLRKKDWNCQEKIAIVHLNLSPQCKHANFEDDRNVPFSEELYPLLRTEEESRRLGNDSDGSNCYDKSRAATETTPQVLQAFSTGSRVTVSNAISGPATLTIDQNRRGSAHNTFVTIATADQGTLDTNGDAVRMTLPSEEGRHSSIRNESELVTDCDSGLSSGGGGSSSSSSSRSSSSSNNNNNNNNNSSSTTTTTTDTNTNNRAASVNCRPNTEGAASMETAEASEGFPSTLLDMQRAASPSNALVSIRQQSFINWPTSGLPSPRRLVIAGFYSLGIADSVRCFYCGIILQKWKESDDPWVVHVQFRFSCGYVKAIMGEDFVRRTLVRLATRPREDIAVRGDELLSLEADRATTSNPSAGSSSHSSHSLPPLLATATPSGTTGECQALGSAPISPPAQENSTSGKVSTVHTPSVPAAHTTENQGAERHSDASSSSTAAGNTTQSHPSAFTSLSDRNKERHGAGGHGLASTAFIMGEKTGAAYQGSNIPATVCCVLGHGKASPEAGAGPYGKDVYNGTAKDADGRYETDTLPETKATGGSNQVRTDRGGTDQHKTSLPSSFKSLKNAEADTQMTYTSSAKNSNVSSEGAPTGNTANNIDRNTEATPPNTAYNTGRHSQGSAEAGNQSRASEMIRNTLQLGRSLESDSEPVTTLPQNGGHAAQSTTEALPPSRTSRDLASRSQEDRNPAHGRQRQAENRGGGVTNVSPGDEQAYVLQLQVENQRLRDSHKCGVCRERRVDTLLLPCGHLCTCSECATTITRCCLCNFHISATVLVYLE